MNIIDTKNTFPPLPAPQIEAHRVVSSRNNSLKVRETIDRIIASEKNGILTVYYKDGSVYTGKWNKSKRFLKASNTFKKCGQGVLITAKGSRYECKFEHDKANDPQGILLRDDVCYVGPFVGGLMHGKGMMEWKDGSRYEGQFKNQLRHGWGKYIDANGRIYEGNFVNGKKEGFGTFKWNGNTYIGLFVNNEPEGLGTLEFENGVSYHGDFANGWMHGQGVMIWKLVATYRGQFVKGFRDGPGAMHWKSGASFIGQFVNNVCTNGIYTDANKKKHTIVDGSKLENLEDIEPLEGLNDIAL